MSMPPERQPTQKPAMNIPAGGGGTPPSPPPAGRSVAAAKHARALSALQRLAKPQPRATGENSSEAEEVGGPGSASGFVGMLAKRQIGEAEFHAIEGKTPAEARAVPPAKYPLQMAREVLPEQSGPPAEPSVEPQPTPPQAEAPADDAHLAEAVTVAGAALRRRTAAGKLPLRYRVFVPVMLALSAVLLAIGCWAGGAVAYMENVTPQFPEEVHYPLIAWSLDVGTMGGYTQGSRIMAWAMLACLPVAFGLMVLAETVRRRNGRELRQRQG